MYFDSHAHYNDNRFNNDREELLIDLNQNKGVSNIINVGYDVNSSLQAVKLADKYDFIYAAVGMHPHDSKDMKNDDYALFTELCNHNKVVAIGESGLDYHYDYSPRDIQREHFARHIELSVTVNKPLIIHEREATKDVLDIIKNYYFEGVFHCFSGSLETAKIVLNKGLYISFAGPVTYKNAHNLAEVARYVPSDRFLIETDCPYLSPEPRRGKRNDSSNLVYIAEKIADIRGTTKEEIAKLTSENAKKLFKI